jgi:phosphoheptose isomerase
VAAVSSALSTLDLDAVEAAVDVICNAWRARGTIYCLGNGGSAALANHVAADLTRLTAIPGRPRQPKVVSLAANTALLSAAANDDGVDDMFAAQLRGTVERGDVVLAFSASGRSANVIAALACAREAGASIIGVTGGGGGRLQGASDVAVVIDSTTVQVIEDVASVVAHALCLLVRERRVTFGD